MEAFELLGTIGEGTYGVVLKARHKESGQIVAIKKFKESDEDEQVRKTALREVRILKQLRHSNVVSLIEVFRRKRKLYLVFEYVESTLLEELERHPEGLDPVEVKRIMWQLVHGVDHLHSHSVIHRDLKPENLLLSKSGVLKLCDFGFARTLAGPGARYTDYVSTRWYRCPELLIGDTAYSKPVDIWALGCLMAEISNGMPLFPGDSDVDQLFQIMKVGGPLSSRAMELLRKNPLFQGVRVPDVPHPEPLEKRLATLDPLAIDVIKQCLRYEPLQRISSSELLRHPYFAGMEESYGPMYRAAVAKDEQANILGRKAAAAAAAQAAQQPQLQAAGLRQPLGNTPAVPLPSQAAPQPVAKPAAAPNQAASVVLQPSQQQNKQELASGAFATQSLKAAGPSPASMPIPHGPGAAAATAAAIAHNIVSHMHAPPAKRAEVGSEQKSDKETDRDMDAHSQSAFSESRGDLRDLALHGYSYGGNAHGGPGGRDTDGASTNADGMSQLSSRIAAAMAAGNMRRDRPMNSGKAKGGPAGGQGTVAGGQGTIAGGQPGFGVNAGHLGGMGQVPGLSQALQRAAGGAWPADVQRSLAAAVGPDGLLMKHPSVSPLGSRSNSPAPMAGGRAGAFAAGGIGEEPSLFSAPQASHSPSRAQARERKEKEDIEVGGPSASSSSNTGATTALGSPTGLQPASMMGQHNGYSHNYSSVSSLPMPIAQQGRRAGAPAQAAPSFQVKRYGSDGKEEDGDDAAVAAMSSSGPMSMHGVGGTMRITLGSETSSWAAGVRQSGMGVGRGGAVPPVGNALMSSSIEDSLASLGLGKPGQAAAARGGLGTRGRDRDRGETGVGGAGRMEGKERDTSRDRSPAATQLRGPGAAYGGLSDSGSGVPSSYAPMHMSVGMPFVIGTGSPSGAPSASMAMGGGMHGVDGDYGAAGGHDLYTEDSLYGNLRPDLGSRAREAKERAPMAGRREPVGIAVQSTDRRGLPSREGGQRSTLQSRGASVVGITSTLQSSGPPMGGYGGSHAPVPRSSFGLEGIGIQGTPVPGPHQAGKGQGGGAGMYISPAAAQAARYAVSQIGSGPGGGSSLASGLSVTGVRRDGVGAGMAGRTLERPTAVSSSHGLPSGMTMGGLSQGSVLLGNGSGLATGHGRIGAGGSYAMTYAHSQAAGYRSSGMGAGAGGGRSSLGVPMSLQGSSTGTLRYPAVGPGAGVGGIQRATQGYSLVGSGLALRGTGAR